MTPVESLKNTHFDLNLVPLSQCVCCKCMKMGTSTHCYMQVMIWSRLQVIANHFQHACFGTRFLSSWFVRYVLVICSGQPLNCCCCCCCCCCSCCCCCCCCCSFQNMFVIPDPENKVDRELSACLPWKETGTLGFFENLRNDWDMTWVMKQCKSMVMLRICRVFELWLFHQHWPKGHELGSDFKLDTSWNMS